MTYYLPLFYIIDMIARYICMTPREVKIYDKINFAYKNLFLDFNPHHKYSERTLYLYYTHTHVYIYIIYHDVKYIFHFFTHKYLLFIFPPRFISFDIPLVNFLLQQIFLIFHDNHIPIFALFFVFVQATMDV